jgi:calcineurin-like phosphoesterase family protein
MKVFIIADTHFNHTNIATYCDRPANFTGMLIKRWNERVTQEDTVIHLGDVAIGPKNTTEFQVRSLNGRKILIRGNHDRSESCSWFMDHGFDFACDGMMFRNMWLTHEPATSRPSGCELNIHGHLHNIWGKKVPAKNQEGFVVNHRLHNAWQRLFAIEYTNYYPIEFDEFVSHPEKYQATGPTIGAK